MQTALTWEGQHTAPGVPNRGEKTADRQAGAPLAALRSKANLAKHPMSSKNQVTGSCTVRLTKGAEPFQTCRAAQKQRAQKLSERKGQPWGNKIAQRLPFPLLKMYARPYGHIRGTKCTTFEVVVHVAALHRACREPQQL